MKWSSTLKASMAGLTLAVHQHRVMRLSGMAPLVMERAAEVIAIHARRQQFLAVRVEQEAVLRVMPVALAAKRACLKQHVNVICTVGERSVKAGDANAVEHL